MLLRPLQILFLITTPSFSLTHETKLIHRTLDFIDSFLAPVKITTYTCWTREYQRVLWKNLTDKYQVRATKIRLRQVNDNENQLYVVDLSCPGSGDFLKSAEEFGLFKAPTKWVLYGRSDLASEFNFGIDSQVFFLNQSKILSMYRITANGSQIESVLDNYEDFSVMARTNLMGNTIRVSIVITNPDSLNHLWDYRDTHVDAISKLNYIIVNNLLDYLNASRTFLVQPTWGYKNATTGLYSGMVGDLQRDLADIGGTAMFFTVDRIDIVDYIAATTPTYMKFIFRAPPLSYVTNVFTLPFDSSVWHYCFVMVAVVVIFIYLIVIWEWKEGKFREKVLKKYPDVLRPKFFDVIMMEIGAITQQGSDVEPKSNAGRIITIFTFVTLMFLYTSYSANIVALLQSTTNSIRTLEDLLKSRIKLGVEDIVYAHFYFENAQEPIRKAIYQQKVAPKGQKPNFMSAKEGIRKVQEGFFGFHIELNTGYKLISDIFQEGEKCSLQEIEYVNFIEPWLATQKKSPYKEIMKIGLRRMHEYGIQNREVRKIYTRKPQCHTGGSNFDSVGMIDCYSAFLIFGIGVGMAISCLIFEMIVEKISKSKIST